MSEQIGEPIVKLSDTWPCRCVTTGLKSKA
jgi:hypothetical protein